MVCANLYDCSYYVGPQISLPYRAIGKYDTIKNLCPDSDGDVYFEQFSSNGVQCPAGFYK